jgi:hypothetical protein
VVPTWTLVVVAIAGVAVGVVLGRLTAPSQPSGGSAMEPSPGISEPEATAMTAVEPASPEEAAPAAPVEEPAAAEDEEAPRIDMEDVVSELERRYQGRRAEEEKERAKRKPPAEGV